jgi:formylmethanofuran dehydrogenase subunit C
MIKVILHLAKAAIAAITALLVFSCNMGSLDGTGNVTTQKRAVTEDFKSVSADRTVEVVIEQGPARSITVEADDNFQEHIKTEIRNGELEISSDEDLASGSTRKVYVTLPSVEKIKASSSAVVTGKNTLRGDTMEFSTSSGGTINITAEVQELAVEANSGGQLKIRGRADNLQADASSGSKVDTKGLTAKSVNAEASSGGNVYVNPVESLTANASSGGAVYYTNTPEKLDKKTSSGGYVKQD